MTRWERGEAISGGHRAVEEALIAQFGDGFARFAVLRRRRHELDYPTSTYSEASTEEAQDAINTARRYMLAAEKIQPELGFFSN